MEKTLPVVEYTPESQLAHPRRLARAMLHDLRASRELAWRLFVRNINARYRQTILRYGWAVVPPIVTTIVFVFLRNSGYFSVAEQSIPYPLFVLTGLTLWQLFADALNAPLRIVGQSMGMLAKVNFPREALILAGVGEVVYGFLIRFLIITIVMIWYRAPLHGTVFLMPIGLISLITLGIALGLLLLPIGMLYQDISQGLPFVMSMWMFVTPVLYPGSDSNLGQWLMWLNPVAPLLDITRAWLLTGSAYSTAHFFLMTAIAISLLFLGWIIFRLAVPILIVRLGA